MDASRPPFGLPEGITSRRVSPAGVPSPVRVSVILPTYNERGSLALLYPPLARALAGLDAELVVVDDGSPDGTADYAETLTAPVPTRVVRRAGKLGLSSAVLSGFRAAGGDVLVVMDADGSHPPEVVPHLVEAVGAGGAEFALGSRRVPGGSARGFATYRRLLSAGAALLARPLVSVRDPMSGFFALRRSILSRSPLAPIGYKIGLEVLVKCWPEPVLELPIEFRPRLAGESKLGRGEIGRYLRHVGRLYAWRLAGRRRASSTR